MNQQILHYIKSQRVGVLAVEMPDGSPHAATLHFAHSEDPFVFYFETDPKTKKAEALLGKVAVRASFVIGSNEGDMKTLQMDGEVRVIPPEENNHFEEIYFGRFPQKKGKHADQVSFTFTPTWWRFTDWGTPEGKRIWVSE